MIKDKLLLEEFLPYKLSYLTNLISDDLSKLHTDQYGIANTEWRVMAVLGVSSGVSAGHVAEKTAMDKVAVSRAINNMIKNGLIERHFSKEDKRRSELMLSEEGENVYRNIVPLVLQYEDDIMGTLSENERRELTNILAKLIAYIKG
jgi:DNA-binding MarR family transcriptional regulator